MRQNISTDYPVLTKQCLDKKLDGQYFTANVYVNRITGDLQSIKHMSLFVRKPAFCICENKDTDQLRGDREADQRLCFRYTDSTIPLLPKSEISSL